MNIYTLLWIIGSFLVTWLGLYGIVKSFLFFIDSQSNTSLKRVLSLTFVFAIVQEIVVLTLFVRDFEYISSGYAIFLYFLNALIFGFFIWKTFSLSRFQLVTFILYFISLSFFVQIPQLFLFAAAGFDIVGD